jgi:hypothetical protein
VQFLSLQVQVRDSHSSLANGFSTLASARTEYRTLGDKLATAGANVLLAKGRLDETCELISGIGDTLGYVKNTVMGPMDSVFEQFPLSFNPSIQGPTPYTFPVHSSHGGVDERTERANRWPHQSVSTKDLSWPKQQSRDPSDVEALAEAGAQPAEQLSPPEPSDENKPMEDGSPQQCTAPGSPVEQPVLAELAHRDGTPPSDGSGRERTRQHNFMHASRRHERARRSAAKGESKGKGHFAFGKGCSRGKGGKGGKHGQQRHRDDRHGRRHHANQRSRSGNSGNAGSRHDRPPRASWPTPGVPESDHGSTAPQTSQPDNSWDRRPKSSAGSQEADWNWQGHRGW